MSQRSVFDFARAYGGTAGELLVIAEESRNMEHRAELTQAYWDGVADGFAECFEKYESAIMRGRT